jgi:hypothetical protein
MSEQAFDFGSCAFTAGCDDVYVMLRESITCVRWRARIEIEKHPRRQTMSATAFIVSGTCHDAKQGQLMIEYGYDIAVHPARAPKDARVIVDPGRCQQVTLDRGAGLARIAIRRPPAGW